MISVNSLYVKRGDIIEFNITGSKETTGTFYWHETYSVSITMSNAVSPFWSLIVATNQKGDKTIRFDTSQLPADKCGVGKLTVWQNIAVDSWTGQAPLFYTAEFDCDIDDKYKPKITCDDEISADGVKLENYILAGSSRALLGNINITNAMSDDTSPLRTIIKYSANGITGQLVEWAGTQHNKTITTPVLPAADNPYEIVIQIIATDERNRQDIKELTATVYPYHKPTKTSHSYVSRVNQDGLIDGRGHFGKVRYEWDISPVNNANRLISYQATIHEKDGEAIAIQPTSGSIEEGYYEYIFPASQLVDTIFQATMSDRVYTDVEDVLVLSSSSVPLSLFDGGEGTGVSIGREATERGFWVYDAFYLKGTDDNSGKIFQIMINDDGQISAKLVRNETTHSNNIFKINPLTDILNPQYVYGNNGISQMLTAYVRVSSNSEAGEEVIVDTALTTAKPVEVSLLNGMNYKIEYYLKVGSDADFIHPTGDITDEYGNVIAQSLKLDRFITGDGTYIAKWNGIAEKTIHGFHGYTNMWLSSIPDNGMYGDFTATNGVITPATIKITDLTTGKLVAKKPALIESMAAYLKTEAGHQYKFEAMPLQNTLKSGWTLNGVVSITVDGTTTEHNMPYTLTAQAGKNYTFSSYVNVNGGRRVYLADNVMTIYYESGVMKFKYAITYAFNADNTPLYQVSYSSGLNQAFVGGRMTQNRIGNFEKGKKYIFKALWDVDLSEVSDREWYVNDVATGVKTSTFEYTIPNNSDTNPIKITIK